MATCKFCNQEGLDWYQDSQEKWKLGIKLDINNYRQHKCNTKEPDKKICNARNWITIDCKKCGYYGKQNVKLHKSLNLSTGCNCCED